MRVLIACEESQRVCIAFRERGHEAYSCDLIEPSGGHPEWHILDDCVKNLSGGTLRRWMESLITLTDGISLSVIRRVHIFQTQELRGCSGMFTMESSRW